MTVISKVGYILIKKGATFIPFSSVEVFVLQYEVKTMNTEVYKNNTPDVDISDEVLVLDSAKRSDVFIYKLWFCNNSCKAPNVTLNKTLIVSRITPL